MAVTIGTGGRTLIMTAAADAHQQPILCSEIRLVGDTMTAGQKLVIKNRGASSGDIIAEHVVKGANEDEVVWGPYAKGQWIDRIYIDTVPAAGAFKIIFTLL